MAFWQQSNIEPKRAYRFILSVPGQQFNIPEFLIKGTAKPSFAVSESTHEYLNHTFKFPSRVTWQDITFTIVDVLGDDNGSGAVMKLLEQSGYRTPISANVKQTISKKKATEAFGQIYIKQIDSEGVEQERWTLNNAWIKSAEFGKLSYDSDDMLNVEVTLSYDNAFLTVKRGQYSGNTPSQA